MSEPINACHHSLTNNKNTAMWTTKKFKNAEKLKEWTENNSHKYQIVEIAINNGWAVDYKKLQIIG